ncbi:MAG: hypothetical protein AAGG38_14315 [Planctomycetota bacterium]
MVQRWLSLVFAVLMTPAGLPTVAWAGPMAAGDSACGMSGRGGDRADAATAAQLPGATAPFAETILLPSAALLPRAGAACCSLAQKSGGRAGVPQPGEGGTQGDTSGGPEPCDGVTAGCCCVAVSFVDTSLGLGEAALRSRDIVRPSAESVASWSLCPVPPPPR